jgi:hypothetical protein
LEGQRGLAQSVEFVNRSTPDWCKGQINQISLKGLTPSSTIILPE